MLVEAAIVRLRLAETFVISRGSADWSDVVQVEIRHGDHVGRGEAAPIERYDETAESAQAFIREHAALHRRSRRGCSPPTSSAPASGLYALRFTGLASPV